MALAALISIAFEVTRLPGRLAGDRPGQVVLPAPEDEIPSAHD
jgi:hypothetical protein